MLSGCKIDVPENVQVDGVAACTGENTAAYINCTNGESGVVMCLVTGFAVAGPAAFSIGNGRITPKLGSGVHHGMFLTMIHILKFKQ